MSEDHKDLIIVAQSARALAQSARRGGWRPLVADAFADVDTKAAAHHSVQVAMEEDGLNERQLLDALGSLPGAVADLIYGAGPESAPLLLERLSKHYRIIGNAPGVVRSVKDPRTFFQILKSLAIPFPETRFEPPTAGTGAWLTKRARGAGGGHIRWWNGAPVGIDTHYFQRYQPGPAMSVLFVADGGRAQMIGYNTQWRGAPGAPPFTYAGAINRARLTRMQREALAGYVGALTRVFGLRGLNGLDFILHRGAPLVLEVNPRPTATCELYEPETREGMVALHVRACSGQLEPASTIRHFKVRAHAIVYAQTPYHAPQDASPDSSMDAQWPPWCRDRPRSGSNIAAGDPVCSVHAQSDDIEGDDIEGDAFDFVQQQIRARRQSVLTSFNLRPLAA